MNTGNLLLASVIYFIFAYIVYGRFLEKIFGVDKKRICPSERLSDGIDYVKTNPCVLYGHHFASIAGAGPIVGPVLAARYGWLPAVCWILVGCVFIGAMHDFAAMFLSVRNDGRSIAYVVEKELGYAGRQIFLCFCLLLLILVVAVFADQVAVSFVKNPAVATSSILFIALAPIMGCLIKNKELDLIEASLIFVPLTFLGVWIGTLIPCDLQILAGLSEQGARTCWVILLLYYAFIASTIPVWFLLQPRDYLNSFLLYGMIILGLGGILVAHLPLQMPALNIPEGEGFIPDVFPLLFVTIACGACSGFHSLVASGTSSKQLANERDIRKVGYGGMLMEGVLAIIAVCSVSYLTQPQLQALFAQTHANAPTMFAMGVGHFAAQIGIPAGVGTTFITLAISAFILTSLDTGTRLTRFLWEELVLPRERQEGKADAAPGACRKFLANRWVSTTFVVLFAFLILQSGESAKIWPVFGSANQLLAAMTLLTVVLYLLRNKCRRLFACLPMFFMWLVSVFALFQLAGQHLFKDGSFCIDIQGSVAAILIVMAFLLAVLAFKSLKRHISRKG